MRLGDLDALSAFVGDLRSTLHKEQSTFKAMTQSEFEIKDNMYLNFQYAIDNAPTVVEDYDTGYQDGLEDGLNDIGYAEGHVDGVLQGEKLYAPKLGEWIDHSDEGYVECPFCGSATTCEDNKDELHYCFSCGAFLQ